MHIRQCISFSQNICMYKYYGWGIFLFFFWNDGMYCIYTLCCLMFQAFSEPWNGLVKLWALSAQLGLRIYSSLLVIYLFFPGCLVHLADIGWQSSCGIILVPWFPSDKGDLKFSEGLLFSCKLCPGKSSTCLLFSLSLDEEGLNSMSYLLNKKIPV